MLTDTEWVVLGPLVELRRPHAQGATNPFSPHLVLAKVRRAPGGLPDEA